MIVLASASTKALAIFASDLCGPAQVPAGSDAEISSCAVPNPAPRPSPLPRGSVRGFSFRPESRERSFAQDGARSTATDSGASISMPVIIAPLFFSVHSPIDDFHYSENLRRRARK